MVSTKTKHFSHHNYDVDMNFYCFSDLQITFGRRASEYLQQNHAETLFFFVLFLYTQILHSIHNDICCIRVQCFVRLTPQP